MEIKIYFFNNVGISQHPYAWIRKCRLHPSPLHYPASHPSFVLRHNFYFSSVFIVYEWICTEGKKYFLKPQLPLPKEKPLCKGPLCSRTKVFTIIDSRCQPYNWFLKGIKLSNSGTCLGTPRQRENWPADMQMGGSILPDYWSLGCILITEEVCKQ